jgi:hypothetical protein
LSSHSFSRFVYCDTNILSHVAKSHELWRPLSDYLMQHDLTLGVGSGQLAELTDADRLHDQLAAMFVCLPSALIKTPDVVLSEEVAAYPNHRRNPLLLYPLNALLGERDGPEQLRQYLGSPALRAARRGQQESARLAARRHAELKDNFPPARGGKYTRAQAGEFAWIHVVQWLSEEHLSFLKQFGSDASLLQVGTFASVRLSSLVLFYKYYLAGREPSRPSDFGDLAHLFAIPYCVMAIMERDLADTLRQIKRHDEVLAETTICDIDFFKLWTQPTI